MAATSRELTDLCHLLSCRQVTPLGEEAVPSARLQSLWTRLRSEHPDWFLDPNSPQ